MNDFQHRHNFQKLIEKYNNYAVEYRTVNRDGDSITIAVISKLRQFRPSHIA